MNPNVTANGDFLVPLSWYLDYIPAYDISEDLSELFDLSRMVIDSENYYYRGYCWPKNGQDSIGGLTNFEGQLSIPHGSIILTITGFSSQPDGFKWELYDNGAKVSFFARTWGRNVDACGVGGGSGILDVPVGPNILSAPFIVMPSTSDNTGGGRLTLQLTNLSASTATIQLFFQVAVPISRETLTQDVVHQAKV